MLQRIRCPVCGEFESNDPAAQSRHGTRHILPARKKLQRAIHEHQIEDARLHLYQLTRILRMLRGW